MWNTCVSNTQIIWQEISGREMADPIQAVQVGPPHHFRQPLKRNRHATISDESGMHPRDAAPQIRLAEALVFPWNNLFAVANDSAGQ